LHVGLLLPYLEKGGTEEHALALAGYVAGTGARVSIVAPQGARDADLKALPVRRLEFVRFDRSFPKGWATYRKALRTLLEKEAPDVLHVHGGHELLAALPGPARRVPAVFTNHGYHGPNRAVSYRTAAWICNRFADRCIAVSEHEEAMMRRYGFDHRKLRLIYNGVPEPAHRDPCGLVAESPAFAEKFAGAAMRIAAVARLEAAKGIEFLVRAMSRLKEERLACVVFGDGSLRGPLESLARSLGVAGSVHFAGYVPHASAYLRGFDLLVAPSLEEPFGLVCAEAMACGIPVVASRVGGIPEIVNDGETGLLVPPGDDELLAAAIVRLSRDPQLRRSMGRAGMKRYLELFSIERMGDAVMRLYEELAASRARRS